MLKLKNIGFKFTPARIVAISFLATIIVGGVLLSLPFSQNRPIHIIDSFFTATSAVCVTGLTVVDIAKDYSFIGQLIILILIQVGGLGIMTFSTFFLVTLGKKLGVEEQDLFELTLTPSKSTDIVRLLFSIFKMTIIIELVGVITLYILWPKNLYPNAIWHSIFQTISAFCNAGLSTLSGNLGDIQGYTSIHIVMSLLIILGGLGFIVLDNLKRSIKRKGNLWDKFTLQTKLVLTMSVALILSGTLIIFLIEHNNALKEFKLFDQLSHSYFQSVTTRTAGFNTVTINKFSTAPLFYMVFLMFIGGSPGSTAGGIKTTTFALMIIAFLALRRNRRKIEVFKRTIPQETVNKALIVLTLCAFTILSLLFFLTITERYNLFPNQQHGYFFPLLFESVSAFCTVGLSLGITPYLTTLGKIIIILLMYIGRIGPLTFALAITTKEEQLRYSYPEERIMVG